MKAILLLAMFAISFGAMAQEKKPVKLSDLKGPEYKNYKFWKHQVEPTKVSTAGNTEKLQGPEFKNRKVEAVSDAEQVAVITTGDERQKLQGPEYKNYKF